MSVALGALVALVPLLNSDSDWDSWIIPAYAALIGILLLVAGLCGWAGRSIQEQRAESVGAIKADLDRLLGAYEISTSGEDNHDVSRHFIRRIHTEAQDNRRLIQQAQDHGRYWKVTETAPSTKEWKDNSIMIEDESELSAVYEKGRRAASEVERVLTARSLRMFRGGRVRDDDRLGAALDALDDFDEAVSAITAHPQSRSRALG